MSGPYFSETQGFIDQFDNPPRGVTPHPIEYLPEPSDLPIIS